MRVHLVKVPAVLLLLALGGCATLPNGPSVMVLPTPGKPFELFQNEDAICRRWASQQIGISPQEGINQTAVNNAAIGTAVGAGIGALLGAASGNAGAGAAIGAGGGLLVGSTAGADSARVYGYEAQRRYDNSYLQCMYSYGNQVPGAVQRNYRSVPAPPAPSDYPSVPPDYPGE